MKKIMPILFIIALAACNKNTSTNGGSWIFHNQTYKATQAFYVLGGITAYTGAGTPTGSMTLWFYDSTSNATLDSLAVQYYRTTGRDTVYPRPFPTNWPPLHQAYALCSSYPPDSGQVFMQITDTAIRNSWVPTGEKTVYVTVAPLSKGLYTFTIPPVEVINNNDTIDQLNPLAFIRIGTRSGTDSSLVSGTIIQTK